MYLVVRDWLRVSLIFVCWLLSDSGELVSVLSALSVLSVVSMRSVLSVC